MDAPRKMTGRLLTTVLVVLAAAPCIAIVMVSTSSAAPARKKCGEWCRINKLASAEDPYCHGLWELWNDAWAEVASALSAGDKAGVNEALDLAAEIRGKAHDEGCEWAAKVLQHPHVRPPNTWGTQGPTKTVTTTDTTTEQPRTVTSTSTVTQPVVETSTVTSTETSVVTSTETSTVTSTSTVTTVQ